MYDTLNEKLDILTAQVVDLENENTAMLTQLEEAELRLQNTLCHLHDIRKRLDYLLGE